LGLVTGVVAVVIVVSSAIRAGSARIAS
jgi:hypothetical protein